MYRRQDQQLVHGQNRGRTDLWPGKTASARGFNALKALLGELYGLDIRYYVKVNFQGFRKVVNTIGGVQINVQIPVYESQYPSAEGRAHPALHPGRPAAHDRRRGAPLRPVAPPREGGDFDRGRRQQRVLLCLARADERPGDHRQPARARGRRSRTRSRPTSRPSELPKLLALAEGVDTRNIRSFVFSPCYYANEFLNSPRGYIITPNVSRIRKAVDAGVQGQRRSCSPSRERLESEGAAVWVSTGRDAAGARDASAEYLEYQGLNASAPRQVASTSAPRRRRSSSTTARRRTCRRRSSTSSACSTRRSRPPRTRIDGVDIVITLGKDAPDLRGRRRRLTASGRAGGPARDGRSGVSPRRASASSGTRRGSRAPRRSSAR